MGRAEADAAAAAKHCSDAEARLKALQEEQAARAQLLQQQEDDLSTHEAQLTNRDSVLSKAAVDYAAECERLTKLKEEMA